MNWRSEWQSVKDEWVVLSWAAALVLAIAVFVRLESWLLKPIPLLAYGAWVLFTFRRAVR